MNELMELLTSKEILVVYAGALMAILLCSIIFIVEKNNEKLRRKHNTRELNKLVEEIKEEVPELQEEHEYYEKPVLQVIEEKEETSAVEELIENTLEIENLGNVIDYIEEEPKVEEEYLEPIIIEPIDIVTEVYEDEPVGEEELEYTTIEPDQETAQLELKKLTEELRKQSEVEVENIALTSYEEQQEENAIISLDELVRKSKDIYEANELSQYVDEGNEPISLQDLERQVGTQAKSYEEPFIIENVVPEEDILEVEKEIEMQQPKIRLDDFNTIKASTEVVNENESKRFKNSPIISPIFGIERREESNDLELENTANYEKLDQEIKRTNEFLMSLKELQNKLD